MATLRGGSGASRPTLIAPTTPKTVTADHGGSKFADTTDGGVAEGGATGESVSASDAAPNRTAVANAVGLDPEDTQ